MLPTADIPFLDKINPLVNNQTYPVTGRVETAFAIPKDETVRAMVIASGLNTPLIMEINPSEAFLEDICLVMLGLLLSFYVHHRIQRGTNPWHQKKLELFLTLQENGSIT